MIEKRPICAVTISFILGVYAFSGQPKSIMILCALAALVGALFVGIARKHWIIALFIVISFICGGGLTIHKYTKFKSQEIFAGEKSGIYGTVIDVHRREDLTRLLLHISKINEIQVDYNIFLYIPDAIKNYTYGDMLYTITQLNEPQKARFNGDSDYELMALAKGYRTTAYVNELEIDFLGNWVDKPYVGKWAFDSRQYIKRTLFTLFPEDEANLAVGITLGDNFGMSGELYENIKSSGSSHITALSGLNTNIILVVLLFLVSRISRKRILSNVIICTALVGFALMVNYSPSIARAVIMVIFAISATLFWRRSEVFTNLAIAALIILIFNPYAFFDVSFQLSFAAVIGIAVYIAPIPVREQHIPQNIFVLAAVSVACILTTVTIVARYFNSVNLTSIWTGILIVPLTSFALIGSYALCLINLISPTLATFFAYSNTAILGIMNAIIKFAAENTMVAITVRKFTWSEIAIYFSFLYLIYCVEERTVRTWLEKRS